MNRDFEVIVWLRGEAITRPARVSLPDLSELKAGEHSPFFQSMWLDAIVGKTVHDHSFEIHVSAMMPLTDGFVAYYVTLRTIQGFQVGPASPMWVRATGMVDQLPTGITYWPTPEYISVSGTNLDQQLFMVTFRCLG